MRGRARPPDVVRAYVNAGFSVLLFDLRAHGRSGGQRLGLGWHERSDVRAAVALLTAQGFKRGRIGLHGVSYGAATALLAAAEMDEVGAVVADTAFANIRDVVAGEIRRQTGLPMAFARLIQPGLGLIAWYRFGLDFGGVSPEEAIASVAPRPILLIHGSDDAVTPVESATRLRAAAGPAAELWVLPGRGHTEGVRLALDNERPSPLREAYLRRVTEFFTRAL